MDTVLYKKDAFYNTVHLFKDLNEMKYLNLIFIKVFQYYGGHFWIIIM